MKEIRQSGSTGYTGYERKVISSAFRFTKKERSDLSELLKGFDDKKVRDFIDHLEIDLNMAHWVISRPEPRIQRQNLQNLIKCFDKAEKNILKILISKGLFQILPPRHVNFLMEYMRNEKHPRPETNTMIRRLLIQIHPHLKEVIKTLKSARQIEETAPHHPGGDKYGLVSCITNRFQEYFGPVESYPDRFDWIMDFCFKAVGIKKFDYVRAGLRKKTA